MARRDRGGVYSTQHGELCPACGQPLARCACAPEALPLSDGVVRVGRETKGRKGRGVTVVTGAPLMGAALEELARRLKKRCGSGGTVRGGVIEIQGDHRDVVVEELAGLGWRVVRSGG